MQTEKGKNMGYIFQKFIFHVLSYFLHEAWRKTERRFPTINSVINFVEKHLAHMTSRLTDILIKCIIMWWGFTIQAFPSWYYF
jgi:hypothetical protein